VFGRWRKKGEKHRADKQQGDPHALDREGDPRGGVQSDAYRRRSSIGSAPMAGVAMGGPGGAVPEELTPDERRERDRSDGGG